MEGKSVRNMYSNIAVTNKHTAKLHHVGSLYILTYNARKLKHKKHNCSPAASFTNCVMTLYLLKLRLQMFLSMPITEKNAKF